MCNECYMTYCPESCPGYDPESRPIGRCSRCDEYIYQNDAYVATGGSLICKGCAEELDADAILLICGFSGVFELLSELGVETVNGN